jgi:DNA invertase Pin-like site-specific DNA recombinase
MATPLVTCEVVDGEEVLLDDAVLHAALYLRESESDDLGIERHYQDLTALCRQRKWSWTVYVDNGFGASGRMPGSTRKVKDRPRYQHMMADIEAGERQAIAVWDSDRLVRQQREAEDVIDLADMKGIQLATVSGEFDLSTPNGRANFRMRGVWARMEMEQKSWRQKSGTRQRASNGHPWWASRPFGYDADPDPLDGSWWTHRKKSGGITNPIRLHEVEAPLVEAAYRAVVKGGALHSIAAEWNKAGIKTPKGNKWRGAQVRQLLLAERNMGKRLKQAEYSPDDDGDKYVDGNWPPIVSEDTWRGACGTLANPARRYGGSRARKHLMSGIAICGKCNGRVTSGVTTGTKHRNYRCRHCLGVARNGVEVDAMVVLAVVKRLSRADAVELLNDLTRDDIDKLQAEVDALRAQIKTAEDEYDDGVIDGVRLAARKERVNVKLRPLVARMQDRERAEIFGDLPLGTPEVHGAFDKLSLDRKRRVIRALVTVTINPTTSGRKFLRKDVDVVFPDGSRAA